MGRGDDAVYLRTLFAPLRTFVCAILRFPTIPRFRMRFAIPNIFFFLFEGEGGRCLKETLTH